MATGGLCLPVEDQLRLLHQLLGLEGGQLSPEYVDAILIAIDFENNSGLIKRSGKISNYQAGLAILDLRDIDKVSPKNLIRTSHFVCGSLPYQSAASKRFHFGESIAIENKDMFTKLFELIPQSRNVILVGHGIKNDVSALKALSFDIKTTFKAILDTSRIGGSIFLNSCAEIGLCNLLIHLGCTHAGLHCAGNDANFTMRALLLLAARSWGSNIPKKQDVLSIIRDTALGSKPWKVDTNCVQRSRPLCFRNPVRTGQTRRKRGADYYESKRRYKEARHIRLKERKFFSAEKQEMVRRERATRRSALSEQERSGELDLALDDLFETLALQPLSSNVRLPYGARICNKGAAK